MIIQVPPQLESALATHAKQQGVAPEVLALEVLERQFLPPTPFTPIDDWERQLFSAAVAANPAITDVDLSRERLHE